MKSLFAYRRRKLMATLCALGALGAGLGARSVVAAPADDFIRAIKGDDDGALIRLFNRGFDPNTRDAQGQPGLILALKEPSPKVVKVFLDFSKTNVELRNRSDESPLMIAALKGDEVAVRRLIARDADINKTGWAPLHYAATNGHVAIMKILLEQFAFIDAESPNGTTPLMMAAMYGSTEAVKLLLDEGADLHMRNQQGMTALDFAQRGSRPDAVALITEALRSERARPARPREGTPAGVPAAGAAGMPPAREVAPVPSAPASEAKW